MHDVGEALDGMELLHLNRAEPADLPQIVPPQVHQHIVLGQLLLIGEQLLLHGPVLLRGLSSGPCARQGKVCSTPFSSFTRVSGDAPATSTSVPEK